MSDPGLALSLNSSYLGFYAHAGFLEQLDALGVRPGHVAGASAGAFVVGLYAGGKTPPEIVELIQGPALRRAFEEWDIIRRLPRMVLGRPGATGALNGNKAAAFLRRHIGDRRIEECRDPRLALAVTNLCTAESQMAVRGPLADFIVASCAFPGLFAARNIGGEIYWDGGIANPVPFEHWLGDPAIHTILIHTICNDGEIAAREAGVRLSVFGAVNLSHQIISSELLRLRMEAARHAGKRLLMLETFAPRPSLRSVKRAQICLEAGRETARKNAAFLRSTH